MIEVTEASHRTIIATYEERTLEERRRIERETGEDPGSAYGQIKVEIHEEIPTAATAEMMRAIADSLEGQG